MPRYLSLSLAKNRKNDEIVYYSGLPVLFQFVCYHVGATGTGEQKLADVSLRQVLEQIREQTNLQFMMSKEQGERVGRVSVNAENETVAEVLDKIFASTGLTWVVKEDIIVVKERPQQQKTAPGPC